MRTESGMVSIPEITEDIEVSGVLTRHVTVREGATLHLSGVASAGLAVEAGGRALIRGVVNGNVSNQGGRVEVWGIVNGVIHNQSGGRVTVHRDAIVDSQRAASRFDL